jgi:hypothetical protein
MLNDINLDEIEVNVYGEYDMKADVIIQGNGFRLSKADGHHFDGRDVNLILDNVNIYGGESGGNIETGSGFRVDSGDLIIQNSIIETCRA